MADFAADGTQPGAGGFEALRAALDLGGPAMWAIAALSVLTLAVILWKLADFARAGAWSGGARTARAITLWSAGDHPGARAVVAERHSLRARLARAAMAALDDPDLDRAGAEAYAQNDPYTKAGLFAEVRITAVKQVLPK